MNISDKGLALTKASEGLVLTAYPDPGTHGDPWTIGYGHTGPEVHQGMSVSPSEAEELLRNDLAIFEAAVSHMAPVCTQGQFDALVDFAFNCGRKNLQGSTLLRLHNAGEYGAASNEFGKWTHAAGHVLPGLVKRRAAEAALYRS